MGHTVPHNVPCHGVTARQHTRRHARGGAERVAVRAGIGPDGIQRRTQRQAGRNGRRTGGGIAARVASERRHVRPHSHAPRGTLGVRPRRTDVRTDTGADRQRPGHGGTRRVPHEARRKLRAQTPTHAPRLLVHSQGCRRGRRGRNAAAQRRRALHGGDRRRSGHRRHESARRAVAHTGGRTGRRP